MQNSFANVVCNKSNIQLILYTNIVQLQNLTDCFNTKYVLQLKSKKVEKVDISYFQKKSAGNQKLKEK